MKTLWKKSGGGRRQFKERQHGKDGIEFAQRKEKELLTSSRAIRL